MVKAKASPKAKAERTSPYKVQAKLGADGKILKQTDAKEIKKARRGMNPTFPPIIPNHGSQHSSMKQTSQCPKIQETKTAMARCPPPSEARSPPGFGSEMPKAFGGDLAALEREFAAQGYDLMDEVMGKGYEAERLADLAKGAGTKQIPFPGTGRDPATLVGVEIVGAEVDEFDYPMCLQCKDGERVTIEMGGAMGRYHSLQCDGLLSRALTRATKERPVKILKAATVQRRSLVKGRRMYMVGVQKPYIETYKMIGLRVQGMTRIGYIWGQDTENDEMSMKYCDAMTVKDGTD